MLQIEERENAELKLGSEKLNEKAEAAVDKLTSEVSYGMMKNFV